MNWTKNIFLISISVFVALLALELGLRFFPVSSGGLVNKTILSNNNKPFDVVVNKNAEFEYARRWNFVNSRIRKTNNLGFFADYDYELGHQGIFVVGDSFGVAMEVDFNQSFHQLLAAELGQPIYNIALSGAPLSQYQAYVKQVCQDFKPTKILIPIIENDFDQSMFAFRKNNGIRNIFFYYKNGELTSSTYLVDNFGYTIRQILGKSYLIRYIYLHLGVVRVVRNLAEQEIPDALIATRDFTLHQQAADIFLKQIKNYCLQPENFVFIVDANRALQGDFGIYSKDNPRLPYMQYFLKQAREEGFGVVDLTPLLREDFLQHGKRFEFPFDGHWNAYAHKLIAEHLLTVIN